MQHPGTGDRKEKTAKYGALTALAWLIYAGMIFVSIRMGGVFHYGVPLVIGAVSLRVPNGRTKLMGVVIAAVVMVFLILPHV